MNNLTKLLPFWYSLLMNWSNKSLSFLGLNQKEVLILEALVKAETHKEVAKKTKIPRTTVAFVVQNLIKKGLILPIKHGKRFRYISLTEEQLQNRLRQTLGEMKATAQERKGAQIRISKESEFIIHIGIKEVIEAYSRIATLNKDTRIKAIQSYKSWITIIEKLGPQDLIRFNQFVRDNNLIIDGILQDKQYDWYGEYLKEHPQAESTDTAESLGQRMADYTLVHSEYFNVYSEIWIFRSTVIIINWRDEVAIEITNDQMMSFLRDMFEFVKMGGKKINHEEYLKEMMDKIKQ